MAQPVRTVDLVKSIFDQMVVDTGDKAAIEEVLGGLGIACLELDEIPAFGLTLLAVSAVTDDQIDARLGGLEARAEIAAYNHKNGVTTTVTAFDVLVRLVRNRCDVELNRDVKIGKNRDVDQLEALPHLGGGGGLPVPAKADDFRLYNAPKNAFGLTALAEKELRGPRIGVLDSAMYPSPGLDGRFATTDLVTDRPPRRAWEGHAAFVVGRILLRAPAAEVVVRRVLDTNGMAKAWDVAYQMAAILDDDITILSMSLGCITDDDAEPFVLARAVEKVTEKAVIVAAAGNHGNEDAVAITEGRTGLSAQILTTDRKAKAWPAASKNDGVVAVGAAVLDEANGGVTLIPAAFTPQGDWVDVWAPGVDQVSTFLEGYVEARTAAVDGDVVTIRSTDIGTFAGYGRWSGTSTATGDVTGEIAKICARDDVTAAQAYKEIKGRPTIKKVDPTDVRPSDFANDWD